MSGGALLGVVGARCSLSSSPARTWAARSLHPPPFHLPLPPLCPLTMATRDIVSDPSLLPVLDTSADTLQQFQTLLSLLDPTSASLASDPKGTSLAASQQQKHLFAQLAQLRGQNRDAIIRVRQTKQLTAEDRQEIDRLHLQLQNLYYEQRHLSGEISACESYEYGSR